ncbi:MAG: hypothetical protein II998_05985 [Clostridia bacterium]|nr:hypothetical protein [Clostridia bacterium]
MAEILGKDTNVLGKAFSNRLSIYKKEATGKDGKINTDLITEEMVAEVVSHVVSGDVEFINALANQDRGFVKRIFDAVKDYFEKVTKRYTGDAEAELSPEMKAAVDMLKKEQAKVIKAFEKVLDATEIKQGKEVKAAQRGEVMNAKNTVANKQNKGYNETNWKPDLSKKRLRELYERIKRDAVRGNNYVTDYVKWLFTSIDGEKVFALYSAVYPDNPTLIYESKGAQAIFEKDYLSEVLEAFENGKSVDGKSKIINNVLGSVGMQQSDSVSYNKRTLGGRGNNRDGEVLQKKSRRKPRSAFISSLEYIFEIQPKTGVLKSKPETDSESEVSKASISIPPVLNIDAEVQAKLNELVEKYGKINKSPDVNIPKAVSDKKAVRKHAATEIESEVVSREGANTLAEMILRGDKSVTYHPVSNDELLRRAQANFDAVGYENAIIRWFAWAESDKRIMPINIAEADVLIVEAQKRGDTDNYIKLITTLPMISTYHAQVLQAFSIIKKLPGVDAIIFRIRLT